MAFTWRQLSCKLSSSSVLIKLLQGLPFLRESGAVELGQ